MKSIYIVILIFFTSVFITTCTKDDTVTVESGKGTGTLTVNGVKYAMTEGIIYHNPGSSNYDIDLLSELTNNGTGAETLHLVALELYSATSDGLQSGTYNYDVHETSHAGTFTGLIFIDINLETEEASYWYETKSGTIVVKHSDSEYEITLNVMTDKIEYDAGLNDYVVSESDVEITCYYIGSLKPSTH